MIKFWYHKYQLNPILPVRANVQLRPRDGALLKVRWANGWVGYADLFPWPEFGDASIEDQLYALAKAQVSQIAEQSIWLAKRDAQLRFKQKNAFDGASKLRNHFLIPDHGRCTDTQIKEIRNAGFETVKIKVGSDLDADLHFVQKIIRQHPLNVRLDFNSKLKFQEFENFIKQFTSHDMKKIEFIEDPCPWDFVAWYEASKMAPIALDFEYDRVNWGALDPTPFKYVILKPSRNDVDLTVQRAQAHKLKIVVTSSMDHPVGVMHSLSVAADLKRDHPDLLCDTIGCLSLSVYRSNEFNREIKTQGPFILSTIGSGIGFDSILERLEWTEIRR